MVMKNGYRSIGIAIILAVSWLGISCEKGLLTNNNYTTGSSATKDVADSSRDELSSLMHQQAQTLPAPVIAPQPVQKSIITTSALNPDLPFTVVPLDEFGRYTDTIKANIDDVVYIELQGVLTGYYNGAILVKATGADIISIEEGYDYWWNGIGLWWTPASADTTKGGAGTLYNYKHIHSPVSDTYKSEGSSWCAAWEAEANQYGYPPPGYGPAGSLVTGTIISPISEARFYFSGYLGNHSKTRPGLRLGLRLKNSSAVGIDISGHNRYEFSWLNLSSVYSGTITATPRVNYQSVHSEGENAWVQLSYPESAYVGDTITVTAYGELMMDANEYSASVESIDSDGAVITLTNTGVVSGNELGPVSFSVDITHASIWKTRVKIKSLGSHPGGIIFADGDTTVSVLKDSVKPVTTVEIDPQLNDDKCVSRTPVTITLRATDSAQANVTPAGVDKIYYKINEGDLISVDGPLAVITLTAEGKYTILYYAVDKAAPGQPNKEDDKSQEITIDKVVPFFTGPETISPAGTTPGGISATNQTTITITKPVSDTLSGVKKADVIITGKDSAGNSVAVTRTITTVNPDAGTISGQVALPTGMVDGFFSITQTLTDKAGNTSTVPFTTTGFLDTFKPVVTARPDPQQGAWINTPVNVVFTVTDHVPSSGIATTVKTPASLLFTENGAGQIATCYATDNAGNRSDTKTVTLNIDRTKPTITAPAKITIKIPNPETGRVTQAQVETELNKKVTDRTIQINDNLNGSGAVFPPGYNIPPNGWLWGRENHVTITAIDNAGNRSLPQPIIVQID